MKNRLLKLSFSVLWFTLLVLPLHASAQIDIVPAPAPDTLRTIFFTDIHVTPGNVQDSLFRIAVEEANVSNADLVIFGGDLTNLGSNHELAHVHELMTRLHKPWFTIAGNHETTWSESGCTTFRHIFGHDGHVAYRVKGYLFLGYACGPYMKMSDGVVRTEDLSWLRQQVAAAAPEERIISLCHYPLNKDLTNRQVVTATLKELGITASMFGHYHQTNLYNFDGIAGLPGRALLGKRDKYPGYTRMDFFADSVRIYEKPLGKNPKMLYTLALDNDPQILALPTDPAPPAPDYEGRMQLVLQDSAMVLTGAVMQNNIIYYGNSQGVLRAYDVQQGCEVWRHKFADALYTTPLCTGDLVIAGAASGGIWAFDARTGREQWHVDTATAVVGDGLVDEDDLYIGLGIGSIGKIDLRDGNIVWRYDYGRGQVQARPTLAGDKLVFGAWNRHLYCLDAATGKRLWMWNNGHNSIFQSPGHSIPRVADGKVFIVAPDRVATCLDLETGRQIWRDNSRKSRQTTGISEDGKQFYYKTMDGELTALDTSADEYRELWCTDLGWGYEYNPCQAYVCNGIVYVASRLGKIAAVREDGTVLWNVKCCNSAANDFRQGPDGSVWVSFAEGKIFRIP
ncbi:PQQ-binding-like beta-propeller repeat protein [uncultured Alistipes sp.]|jgi:FOG: WD40-like repeat|uniref:outer membrane protein assembly factor BamB family protein n=1 Tax=uncultured Alistipes sp. TaxID=538949 RepID=UPI0025CBB1E3|nr:PQQ-binding-like beta-propeller repeat protein [uncultured Alistipes sp.]